MADKSNKELAWEAIEPWFYDKPATVQDALWNRITAALNAKDKAATTAQAEARAEAFDEAERIVAAKRNEWRIKRDGIERDGGSGSDQRDLLLDKVSAATEIIDALKGAKETK